MNSLVIDREPLAKSIRFSDEKIYILLEDDREIGVPLSWFPKLQNASSIQKLNYRLIGGGVGIHFEDIDEDISISALMK